jgi:hypothetical protein
MRSFLFALLVTLLVGCGTSPRTDVLMVPQTVPTLYSGFTVQLKALVAHNPDRRVTWHSNGGQIVANDTEAVFVAPETPGTYTITATSVGDPSASASIAIRVEAGAGFIQAAVRNASSSQALSGVSFSYCNTQGCTPTTPVQNPTENPVGDYSFQLAGGTYTLQAARAGFLPVTIHGVAVRHQQTTFLEQIQLVADQGSLTGSAGGQITNAQDGTAVPDALLELRAGINATSGTVLASAATNLSGHYTFSNIQAGSYTATVSKDGFTPNHFTVMVVGGQTILDQNASISPPIADRQWRFVLTWGQTPSDLDSHLTGPNPPGAGSGRFHIYFPTASKNYSFNGIRYAELDVDDTTSFGPETTTIYEPTGGAGVYRFSVHDYSNKDSSSSGAMATSGAQVRIFRGATLVATYSVPNRAGTLWTVAELDLTNPSFPILTPINRLSFVSNPAGVQRIGELEFFQSLPQK